MRKLLYSFVGFSMVSNILAEKPNIVFILTDQQTASAMSCAGNLDIKTPHIDQLANEGIRFTNAYCSSPLSTPSRASIFTGLPSGYTQMLKNGSNIPTEIRPNTLGNLVKNKGYDCAYAGKWHLPTNSIEDDEWGFRVLNKYGDRGLAESCINFLNEEHSNPFFMVASFINPHNICQFARGQVLPDAEIIASPLAKCPKLPVNFAIALFEPEVIRIEQQANPALYPTVHFSENDWRQYRDAYYRLVEQIDAEIGKLISTLEKNNQIENTIIFFSSDHGDGVGAHHWNQKSVLYEEVVNIPFIVRLPKAQNRGQVKNQIINNGTDFFATVCDYSDAKLSKNCQGKSLRTILESKESKGEIHQYIVSETFFDRGITHGWMVRTPDFKYVVYDRGALREQLFDMKSDRGEMVNLAMKKENDEQLKRYRHILEKWKKTNKVKYY